MTSATMFSSSGHVCDIVSMLGSLSRRLCPFRSSSSSDFVCSLARLFFEVSLRIFQNRVDTSEEYFRRRQTLKMPQWQGKTPCPNIPDSISTVIFALKISDPTMGGA
jgi:hypothetical protein